MKDVPVIVVGAGEARDRLRLEVGVDGNQRSYEVPCEWPEPGSGSPREDADGALDGFEAVECLRRKADLATPARVEVRLRPPYVQVRRLHDIPPIKSRDLEKLVTTNLERFFRPVEGDPVVAAEWRPSPEGARTATAATTDHQFLDSIVSGLEECGLQVVRFTAVGEEDGADSDQLELITRSMRRRMTKRKLRRIFGATVLALSGWALAAGAYVLDLRADHRVLEAELANARDMVARLDSVEAQISAFRPAAEVFERLTADPQWATATLAAVGRELPNSAHLRSLDADRDGIIELEIEAEEPEAVVDSLELSWDGTVRVVESGESEARGDRSRITLSRAVDADDPPSAAGGNES